MNEVARIGIPVGKRGQVKEQLQAAKKRSMIVDGAVDEVLRSIGRYDDCRYPDPILPEIKPRLVLDGRSITGGDCRIGWRDMIVEAPVFIIGDHQHAALPMRRRSHRFIDRFDERFPGQDIIKGMLRIAAMKILWW